MEELNKDMVNMEGFAEAFANVDINSVETEKLVIAEGDYPAVVSSVEDRVARDGLSRFLSVSYTLKDENGDSFYTLTENYIYKHSTKPFAAEIGFKGICKLAKAIGLSSLQNPMDLENGSVMVHVVVKTRENGSKENRIGWVFQDKIPF